jgi:MFS transporter, FHS family, L-fucose permease
LAQHNSTPFSYVVPMGCFVVVFVFGIYGYKSDLNHGQEVLPHLESQRQAGVNTTV